MIDGNKKDTRTTSKAKMERFEKKLTVCSHYCCKVLDFTYVDVVLVSLLLTFKGANKLKTFL